MQSSDSESLKSFHHATLSSPTRDRLYTVPRLCVTH